MDGTLLPCTDKSKLMGILENLPKKSTSTSQRPEDVNPEQTPPSPKKVTVIDGMAVVQAMGKPQWMKTCAQWADHFNATLDCKANGYDEVHLVFDCYDLPKSLKDARPHGKDTRVASHPLLTTFKTALRLGSSQQNSSFQTPNQR